MDSRNLTSNFVSDHRTALFQSQFGGDDRNWRSLISDIKGESSSMKDMLQVVSKVSRTESPVLICGESGTGKELIARAVHRLSNRANGRFLAINCSAIPESLLEAELFGYVKGAFTGADTRRKGFFEAASGGTVFLDEIGDMPARLQSKLLRVLQEKQFSPIGSNEVIRSNVRIIAATHVNLEKAVKKQSFRLDLFYRLNVLPVNVPALRDRPEDVRILLDHFIQIANETHRLLRPCILSSNIYKFLEDYPWPGNVRELQNLVERLVVLQGGGLIDLEHLPSEYMTASSIKTTKNQITSEFVMDSNLGESLELLPDEGLHLASFIEKLENSLIIQALERTSNNKNQAAKLLGLNRTTLVEKIKKRKLAPLNAPSKEL